MIGGGQGGFAPVCLADLRCIDACSSIRGSLIYLKLRCGTRHEWTFWLWGKPQGGPALGRGRGWPMFKVLKRSEGEDLQWSVLFPSPLQMDKDLSGRLSRVAYDLSFARVSGFDP